jgi:hypothetical protein
VRLILSYVTATIVFLIPILLATTWVARAAPQGKSPSQRVALLSDQKRGTLRILIDGREVAWFDSAGFYVRGDIAYKGTITDGLPSKGVAGRAK